MTDLSSRPWYVRAAPLALALLPAIWLSWPLLGTAPLSYDHATHLFKAWHFWEEMLPQGRLRGWSHFWAFGSPTNELVPLGAEVWVALFRAATLGLLSWLQTYAVAFAGFLVLKSVAAYCFTRVYLGRAAAVACAWLSTLDPGGMLEGGWDWHTYWGVWPVTLAMSLTLLSLSRLERVLRAGRLRDVFWAGAWLGAALLTHQMAMLVALIAAPLLLLDHATRRDGLDPGNALRALGSLAFAFALSAFFLLPFLARTGHTQDLGWLGESLPVVSQKVVELRLFQNVPAVVHALGLIGAWFALRRPVPGGVFLVAAAGVLVVLASGVLIRDLHLERVFASLIKIEANRFLLVAKLFWFPLAGLGAVELGRPLLACKVVPSQPRRALGGLALLALALALFAPGCPKLYETHVEKKIVGESERRYWRDFPAMLDYTRDLRRASDEHYRIAYHMWRGEHLATLAPVFNEALMYKVGYTPVHIYNKLPMTDETELLEALSVKYVVSAYPLKRPSLKEEKRFGELRLYRFENYRPAPFSVLGAGQAELLELSPERLRIRLTGTNADTRLKLHVASFDRWRATLDGAELPITTVPVFGVEYPILMEVPARDGELVLDYVYRGVDWLGLLVTWSAAPAFVAAVWLGRRRALVSRAVEQLRRKARVLGWLALAAALAVTGVVAAGTRTRQRMLPAESIFHRVSPGAMTLGGTPCVQTASLSFKCGAHRVRADVVEGVWGIHRCMTSPDAGELRVRVQTTLGSFLAGSYDSQKEAPGSIRIELDGQELGTVATRPAYLRQQRIQFDTRSRRGQSVTLELVLSGSAHHCFDLVTVE